MFERAAHRFVRALMHLQNVAPKRIFYKYCATVKSYLTKGTVFSTSHNPNESIIHYTTKIVRIRTTKAANEKSEKLCVTMTERPPRSLEQHTSLGA